MMTYTLKYIETSQVKKVRSKMIFNKSIQRNGFSLNFELLAAFEFVKIQQSVKRFS